MYTPSDLRFMHLALDLAKSQEGKTSPDPMVGAVLVRGGKIISTGYHGPFTSPHAEAWAIEKAGGRAKGATLYLNLEPCAHFGNNPPCASLIVKAGIAKVYAAMRDPNPLVAGKGFKILRKGKVKVHVGLLGEEARKLNQFFITYITKKRPFVIYKSSVSLDGKIATRTGDSRWVAGPKALKFSHSLRNQVDAILVGVNTILIDNPKLTVRLVKRIKNPIRIVLDAHARTPLTANVLKTKQARTIIVVGPRALKKKIQRLERKGAEILKLEIRNSKLDIRKLVKKLGQMKITSLLVEGGGEAGASFLEAKLVDKILFVIAPKIIGGRNAKTPVEGKGIARMAQALKLKEIKIERLGEDILIEGYL